MVETILYPYTEEVSHASVNEPEAVCPICMEILKDHARVKSCGHVFDFRCIESWILVLAENSKAPVCPCCRIEMKTIERIDSKGDHFATYMVSLIRGLDVSNSWENPANEESDFDIAEERNRGEYEEYRSSMRDAREAAEQQHIMEERRQRWLEERDRLLYSTPGCTIS
jgi:hypothetical protein